MELIGEYEGSGFKEPPSLARRADGQMIQLTRLLYEVARYADGQRDEAAIAAAVSDSFGRRVSAGNVRTLVEEKLRPLGVLAAADGSSPPLEKPDPLLALRFRKAVIPESRSEAIAWLFKPLFHPPVVLAALAGLVAFDAWLFLDHGVAQSFRQALYEPALLLLVVGLVIVSAGWHELGHAAGCAYGGARPGAMGAGIYLCYPAFYTDVTDSYRLGRAGRLRTDLAGVYFNGLFILAMAGLYALTGHEVLLLVVLVQHLEVAHQLLPVVRLDGYYVLADLTGVPDMFGRIRPILASLVPWRKPDERVTALKPWVRMVVTAWVVVVIPLLGIQLALLLLHAPRIVATAWDSGRRQWDAVSDGFGDGDVLAVLAGVVETSILVVPLVGIAYTLARLGRRLVVGGWRGTEGRPVGRALLVLASAAALGFLAHQWLPNGDYEPIRRGERGTLGEAALALRRAPSGRPGIVTLEEGVERGEVDHAPDWVTATTTTTTTPASDGTPSSPEPSTTTTGEGSSATTTEDTTTSTTTTTTTTEDTTTSTSTATTATTTSTSTASTTTTTSTP